MHLLGRQHLTCLEKLAGGVRWKTLWISEVREAHWKSVADVRAQFPRVRVLGEETFLFPVALLPVAIQVLVAFPKGIALITAVISSDAANEH